MVRVDRFPGTGYLVLDVDGGVHQRLCPRLWRTGRRVATAGDIVVDCSLMGHDAGDLAEWLRGVDALKDTRGAIKDGVTGAIDKVGGWFD